MDNEKLKLWLDFGKFFLGTVLLGFVSLVIKSGFQDREIAVKESDQIGKYVEIALKEDVGVRKRFAEYFKTVTLSEDYRERWGIYFELVKEEYDQIQSKSDSIQLQIEEIRDSVDYRITNDSISEFYKTKIRELQDKKAELDQALEVKIPSVLADETLTIGLHCLNPDEKNKELISKYLISEGFNLKANFDYSYRQKWMASTSTVFYYSRNSESIARQIAADLSSLIGEKFEVSRGAGLGVTKGSENVTFFVHYIN